MQKAVSKTQKGKKIVRFSDLIAWQEGHALILSIYKISKGFPKDELFGLTNQMRRAAVSITSNIAEGFGRRSEKEKMQFYAMAQGSLTELQNRLLIAKDISYLDEGTYGETESQTELVHKLLTGLIKSTREVQL